MKQILIVEDDSFLNKMLDYNLTADGYGVTSALNARTAAEAIRQREFDLVLLDINLPDGNGFELCKLIKPQHPDTIVIFLTANDQESDQIRGYEVGAVDYITKPFVIGALQRKIKAMFAMLEHHKPAKDIYDDGRLFLDFSEQTASLNGKPMFSNLLCSGMGQLLSKSCDFCFAFFFCAFSLSALSCARIEGFFSGFAPLPRSLSALTALARSTREICSPAFTFASSSSTVGVLLMIPSIMFPFCSVVCSAVFKGLSRCACSAATANARVPFPIIRYFPSSDWW